MSGISKEPKSVSKGFGGIPKPNIITPAMGRPKNPNVERFLMMYTCKLCEGRNAQMVSKIAYYKGMVRSYMHTYIYLYIYISTSTSLTLYTIYLHLHFYISNPTLR